jgi:heme-degrading monooxygenase HmoA
MFARCVTMRIKPNVVSEFNQVLEKEVLPLLQKQRGFQDELTLVSPNGSDVLGISLWDKKEDAEAYQRTTFSDVQKSLSKVTEGTPQVQTYDVPLSTYHKTAARHA